MDKNDVARRLNIKLRTSDEIEVQAASILENIAPRTLSHFVAEAIVRYGTVTSSIDSLSNDQIDRLAEAIVAKITNSSIAIKKKTQPSPTGKKRGRKPKNKSAAVAGSAEPKVQYQSQSVIEPNSQQDNSTSLSHAQQTYPQQIDPDMLQSMMRLVR